MRKYQKAAIVVAMLGSVGFLGAGVGHAGDGEPKVKLDNKQSQECSADETTINTRTLPSLGAITNGLGTQFVDQSEHTSVNCAQIFTVGR